MSGNATPNSSLGTRYSTSDNVDWRALATGWFRSSRVLRLEQPTTGPKEG